MIAEKAKGDTANKAKIFHLRFSTIPLATWKILLAKSRCRRNPLSSSGLPRSKRRTHSWSTVMNARLQALEREQTQTRAERLEIQLVSADDGQSAQNGKVRPPAPWPSSVSAARSAS